MRFYFKRLALISAFLFSGIFILLTRIAYLIKMDGVFNTFGTLLSIVPGKLGSFMRVAYYMGTLKKMSPDVVIDFGSFFSRRTAQVGKNVYIGAFCIIGNAVLEDNILIASKVSIPSGKNQHGRTHQSAMESGEMVIDQITIGSGTWIGEGAIVMANVGRNTIIGSGSIVTKPIPDNVVAVGNAAQIKAHRKNDKQ